jgi:hypothetical protein
MFFCYSSCVDVIYFFCFVWVLFINFKFSVRIFWSFVLVIEWLINFMILEWHNCYESIYVFSVLNFTDVNQHRTKMENCVRQVNWCYWKYTLFDFILFLIIFFYGVFCLFFPVESGHKQQNLCSQFSICILTGS